MNIRLFIDNWLAQANAFNTEKFLENWHTDGVLDDPSVGQIFRGHPGIRRYFEDYFIGYKTQTKLVSLEITAPDSAHITVDFTGEFPGGQIGGMFDFVFKDGKIKTARAMLL